MKLIIYSTIILFSVSCTKTQSAKENSEQNVTQTTPITEKKTEITVDSIRISDSVKISKTLTAASEQKVLVFSGIEKPVLDSLYKSELNTGKTTLSDYSKAGIESAMKAQMAKYFDDTKRESGDYMPEYKQTWDKVSEMNVLGNEHGYLTVKYDGYGYTGGAHGYAYENYKVVDLENQKVMKVNDLVDSAKVNWNQIILKNINPELKDLLFEPEKVSFNENFYFDNEGITFVYGQYEIAPYVAGIIPVKVPFADIKAAMKPDFKQRLSIK